MFAGQHYDKNFFYRFGWVAFGGAGRKCGFLATNLAVNPGPSKTGVKLKTKINLDIKCKHSVLMSQMPAAEGCGGTKSVFILEKATNTLCVTISEFLVLDTRVYIH